MKIQMSFKRKTVSEGNIPKLEKQLKEIESKKLVVGIFDEYNAWLAGIHEYGANITAKNGKYLAIPASKEFVGRSPRSVEGLFFVKGSGDGGTLCRESGGAVEACYILKTSVKIPERAFLRNGYAENRDEWLDAVAKLLAAGVDAGNLDADGVLSFAGLTIASKMKTSARNLSSPADSPLTAKNKGSANPLVDTGGMINSITYEIH